MEVNQLEMHYAGMKSAYVLNTLNVGMLLGNATELVEKLRVMYNYGSYCIVDNDKW